MAVEAVFGGHTVWHSEIDKAASKVLAYRWPGVPNLGSITEIDWAAVEPVDVLCGGFPCTDVSAAGKRAGMHGTRSGLWSYMAEAIDVLRPRYVVIENVRGLLNASANRPVGRDEDAMGYGGDGFVLRAIGAVLGDLADIGGYEARWVTVAASSVGAPHRRERVFILADSSRYGWDEGRPESAGIVGGSDAAVSGDEPGVALLPTPSACNANDGEGPETWLARREVVKARVKNGNGMGMPLAIAVQLLPTPNASDGSGGGQHPDKREGHSRQLIDYVLAPSQWGKYAPAIARWESLTRPAPAPTEPNKNGNPRLSAAFSEWLMGWPDGWVTDPAIGISRNDQLRIVGNGVVSIQAEAALRYLLAVTA